MESISIERLRAASSTDWRTFYLNLGLSEDQWKEASELWAELYKKEKSALFPDVKPVLTFLKENGLELGVVSNGRTERVGGEIRNLGLNGFFESLIFHEDVKESKPSPEAILLSLKRLNVQPDKTLYIGDLPEDIIASRRAGTRSVALTRGYSSKERLEAEGPDFIFGSLEEMAQEFFGYLRERKRL